VGDGADGFGGSTRAAGRHPRANRLIEPGSVAAGESAGDTNSEPTRDNIAEKDQENDTLPC
jgi:hypothetical protein